MSQANVEIAKRIVALGLGGEIDALLDLVAEDVVATNLAGPLDEPEVFHGREAALAHWPQHTDVLGDLHREVDEWIDGGDWVINVGHWKGRGKASGAEVEGGYGANASRFHDGRLVEWIGNFPTREAALEAVGLRE